MKRTIQGLIVTSLLLFGCGNSTFQAVPVENVASNEATIREIREVTENLTGICRAITHYGLVSDREIKAYVKRKAEGLLERARVGSSYAPEVQAESRRGVDQIIRRYSRCDPAIAEEITQQLEDGDTA